MFRHLIITGVAAAVVGAVPAAALGAAPSPDPAAKKALTQSVAALDTTSHNIEMRTAHAIIHASVDPARGSGTLTDQEGASRFDETVLGGQVWLKLNIDPATNQQLDISPDTWMSLDMNKLPKNNALPIPPDGSDPVDMPGILHGVIAVTQDEANAFTGRIDLTQIAGRDKPDANEVRRAGAAAKNVPFTAATDASNRMTAFKVDAGGFDPGLSADIKFTGFGTDPKVKAPSSSVPAPAVLYTVLAN